MGKLRFTYDSLILSNHFEHPQPSYILYIGNYPTQELLSKVDEYCKELRPPNNLWDEVLNTGDSKEKGSGWSSTGFEEKYRDYILERKEKLKEIAWLSNFIPVYIAHHTRHKEYSPARVVIEEAQCSQPGV